MKKIKYLLLLIMLLPITAFAYDIKCPSGPYKYQDKFECDITGDNLNYDEFSGTVKTTGNNNLTCSIKDHENGMETITGDDEMSFSRKGTSYDEVLVKVECEVTGQPTTSMNEQLMVPNLKYHVYDSNTDVSNEVLRSGYIVVSAYKEDEPQTKTKPRDTTNPNVRLKIISDENLDFTFSAFKTVYDISVLFDVNKLNLNIVPQNESSTYEIVGSQNLEIGDNVIDIYVTSTDGSQLCYTLNIKRLKRGEEIYYPEKDSSLKSLEIEGYKINFESIILDYSINLKYDVSEIKVTAIPTNENAGVSLSTTKNLNNGDTVEVTVTSEDKSTKTVYMINITKDQPPKDYRTAIYIGAFVVAISIVIIIILKTNNKNKNNPLLGSKKNKEEVKEENSTPQAETVADNTVEIALSEINRGIDTSGEVVKIDLSTEVKPVETVDQVDSNFNVATSNVTTLDLSNAVLPSQLHATEIPNGEVPQVDNTNTQQ